MQRLLALTTGISILALVACQSAPPTPLPTATPPPTATPLPTATPTADSHPKAEATAMAWAANNLPQVRSEIGRFIGSMAGTVQSASVDLEATILESGQEWEDGRAETEVNWVSGSVDLGEDGKWTVQLDAETVTDIEHEGVSGQLKAVTPFLIHGQGDQVESYEVLLDKGELSVEGITVEVDLNEQLLNKEQVDSALESLPSNPFSGN